MKVFLSLFFALPFCLAFYLQSTNTKKYYINKIDRIVKKSIKDSMTPGMVVLVGNSKKIIFSKSYGHHTFEKKQKVDINHLYDLASLTKVLATTIAFMKLYEEGQIALDKKLGNLLSIFSQTDKHDITPLQLLTHRSGLPPYINFFKYITPQDTSSVRKKNFSHEIAENLFLKKDFYQLKMVPKIVQVPLIKKDETLYSDIGMFLLKDILESITGMGMDDYLKKHFYKPMGLDNIDFYPKNKFPLSRIPPTLKDGINRHRLIHGFVHDSNAALMKNGVGGHAGLFASISDLYALIQMIENKGIYKNKRYLKKSTIDLFLKKNGDRLLGFDNGSKLSQYTQLDISDGFYGHSGYTGGCVWIEPKKFILIVLSNRTFPNNNIAFVKNNIRLQILDIVYDWLY